MFQFQIDPASATGEAAKGEYRLRLLGEEVVDGDSAAAQAWERLEAIASLPTQSRDFLGALQHSLLPPGHWHVVAARRAGGIGALMPVWRPHGAFARWRIPGTVELSEPSDALYESEEAGAILAQWVARQARALSFDRLPANSWLVSGLRAAMKRRGLVVVRPARSCPTIALDESWQEPEQRFNAGRRSDFRRAARRAAVLGPVTQEVIAPDPAEFDALFDEAIAIEAKSWKLEAGTAILCDPAKERFFRDYFRRACARGTMRFAFLRIDGQAVAMQMAVETSGRYWLYKIGFNEAFARCSPGSLLMLHTLAYAARAGLVSYELLGDAESWLTDLWTRDVHECVRLRVYPWTVPGMVALATDSWVWLGERLRRQRGEEAGRPSVLRRLRMAAVRLRYALPGFLGRLMIVPDAGFIRRQAAALARHGMKVTAGYFQQVGSSLDEIVAANARAVAALAAKGKDAYLSVKAPPLGFDRTALRSIAEAAAGAGMAIVLDAHAPADADATLAALRDLLPDYPGSGCALPARWRRSRADAQALRDTTARIRLVRGEWADPQWPEGACMEAAYLELVEVLAGRGAPVAVATHRPHVARAALSALVAAGTPCELELLRGLPGREAMAVARELGVPIRLYVPFGPGWWPYALDKALAQPKLPLALLRDRLGIRRGR